MAYQLEITFSGLCFFMPDKTGKLLHVLMPDAKSMAGHEHYPKARYEGDYDSSSTPQKPAPPLIDVDLKNHINWKDVTSTVDVFKLPPDIANVVTLAGGGNNNAVDGKWKTASTGNGLAVRITLPGSIKVTTFNKWKFGNLGVLAASAVGIIADADETKPLKIDGSHRLVPRGGRVQVLLGNMLAADWAHPPASTVGVSGDHFGFYYNFLKATTQKPVPKPDTTFKGLVLPPGIEPTICMLGGGCETDPC